VSWDGAGDPNKEALVTIDAVAPTSAMAALPATEPASPFAVNWSGTDDAGGSGVQGYNIWVSIDGGAYSEWQTDTTSTSALYAPLPGTHTYAFYSQALDNAGNIEAAHAAFDTTTSVTIPPQVIDVLVDGTGWTSGFLSVLQTAGQGNGSGYAIPAGSAVQLTTLSWDNVNQIQIVFNEDVNVSQASLALSGLNVSHYAFSGFAFNSTMHTATWTLASVLGADKLQLSLASSGAGLVKDGFGNALDGEWTNGTSSYPSGNGTPGGDFHFAFNVLPADVTHDGVVNGLDINMIASHWLKTGTTSGDANGDGVVNGLDINALASRWLTTLPAGGGAGSGSADTASVASLANTGANGVTQSLSKSSSAILLPPSELSSGMSSTVTSAVTVSQNPPLFSATQSFTNPQGVDRVAAFVGPQSLTRNSPAIDSLMSQHAGDGGLALGPRALAIAARPSGKSFSSSSALLDSYGSVSDSEPLASSLDEDLLETLVVGRRVGGI
jgi:Dockerin type I domain